MTAIQPMLPGQPVPDISVPLVGGGTWSPADRTPGGFAFVVVYRGLHCPICKKYLLELQDRLPEFAARGVDGVVLSGDPQDRAEKAVAEWEIGKLRVGYGLGLDDARRWGLYISKGRPQPDPAKLAEPPLFVEPGHFLIAPDGTLYFGAVQTMPFSRPALADLLRGIDLILEKSYPPRGTVADHTVV